MPVDVTHMKKAFWGLSNFLDCEVVLRSKSLRVIKVHYEGLEMEVIEET